MVHADTQELMEEMQETAERVMAATERLKKARGKTADHQAALIAYLQATVDHACIVSAMQSTEHEALAAEVAELRARFAAVLGPRVIN